MRLGIKTKQAIQDAVDDQKEFKIGNISGESCKVGNMSQYGRLNEPYRGQLQGLFKARLVRFIIYSYGTPIAWVTQHGTWIVPEVNYSPTTSHHQSVVKLAIGRYNFWNSHSHVVGGK